MASTAILRHSEIMAAVGFFARGEGRPVAEKAVATLSEKTTVLFEDVAALADSLGLKEATREGFIRVIESQVTITMYFI